MAGADSRLFQYVLALDGQLAGRPFKVESRGLLDVSSNQKMTPDPISMECGPGMSRRFYEWIGDAFAKTHVRRNGMLIVLDQSSKPIGQVEFYDALISEVRFPDLDTSAKKDAYLTVKFQPEITNYRQNNLVSSLGVYQSAAVKAWDTAHFRLVIDGLDDSQHATRLESFTVKQRISAHSVEYRKTPELEPTKLLFPNLVAEVPAIYAGAFYDWLNESLKGRANASRAEKTGVIEFHAPGSSDPYFRVNLYELGIISASIPRAHASRAPKFEMYCNRMEFDSGASAFK